MAEEGQDSREMARRKRQCPTVLSIVDGKQFFLAAESQIYLTQEETFLAIKIVLLQENSLATSAMYAWNEE